MEVIIRKKDDKIDNDVFKTSDLGIAVYLFTIGHELLTTTLQGHNRLIFHFKQQPNTDSNVGAFLNETGVAPAKKLFDNYRSLRALAFSKTNNLR